MTSMARPTATALTVAVGLDVADSCERLVEEVDTPRTTGLLEPLVVHGEALDEVLVEALRARRAIICGSVGLVSA